MSNNANSDMCTTRPVCMVTGGLGYIGSHVCVELLANGWDVLIVDNLANSKIEKLEQIAKYNEGDARRLVLKVVDMVDEAGLEVAITEYLEERGDGCPITLVIHLAGLKAVAESIDYPTKYYTNNLGSTLNLINLMEKYRIPNLIFSSSSTVYGTGSNPPYVESGITGVGITNPYGKSKYFQEQMLMDWVEAVNKKAGNVCGGCYRVNVCLLRYFNPISQRDPELSEDPNGIPNNLFPYILKVWKGELDELVIYGSDYGTRDGTCARDFVHVVDLANAHVVAGTAMCEGKVRGLKVWNVGTGHDTTVLELVTEFEKQNGVKLKYRMGERRQGDLETSYSDVSLICKDLGWKAVYSIADCVKM